MPSEHWIEIDLAAELEDQDEILLGVLRPYVERLKRAGKLVTYHFFREPEIRFRVRLNSAKAKAKEIEVVSKMADKLVREKRVTGWHFGNHGEEGKPYAGEEDRYGKNGWMVAQDYFSIMVQRLRFASLR